MRLFLFLISFVLLSGTAWAQQPQQSLELKDGSLVIGEILKKYDDGSVKINAAFGIVIISGDNIVAINDSIQTSEKKEELIERLPLQYQPALQNSEDTELRQYVDAYRKTLATGYTLEAVGLGLIIGGGLLVGSQTTESVGSFLVVAGAGLSIGGIIVLWTSPSKLKLSTDGANFKLNF